MFNRKEDKETNEYNMSNYNTVPLVNIKKKISIAMNQNKVTRYLSMIDSFMLSFFIF